MHFCILHFEFLIMVKSSVLQDSFEKIAELGGSTAKKAGKSVAQIFNPLKIAEKIVSGTSQNENPSPQKEFEKKKDKHTPLDFEKLKKEYADQDKTKTEALKKRLFDLVKKDDEETAEKKKKEEQEKKQQVLYTEQEKRKKGEEKRRQEQTAGAPQGKQRRSIFSPKKMVQRQQLEVRADSGKQ